MSYAIADMKRSTILTGMVVSVGLLVSGCQGARSPVQEMADISTSVKFDSKTFGVPASPRVTTSKNIRKGGGRSQVGKPYKVRGKWYYPKDEPGYVNTGVSSWYGPNFHGRLTANGEVYDMYGLSAAHKTFPLPSYAMVTNLENGNRVMVRVNDRGPYAHGREIDVSSQAADLLDFKTAGTAKVKVEYVGRAPLEGDDTQMLMASFERGGGWGAEAVMVAAAEQPRSALYRPVDVAFGAEHQQLAGVRPLDQMAEEQPGPAPYLGQSVPIPTSPAFTSSYASSPAAAGAAMAMEGIADTSERIVIGVVDGPLVERFRRLGRAHGRLSEETVPETDLVSMSLVVAPGQDTDTVLRQLWQAGADEAFVVRN
ncbi:septal ring lytic transglycosylase RlpA family protein [Aurantimonas marina]|uniref:septal ring lytic transglycosylase RlpA family protein n=1 Tax=Aurantimonas marina TaxID=2780508 RepID=UPI001E2BBED5|nr:septal ring lytic transglycosylase RlpA family protein [Aurantimonas marina]